ncbi:hypothetical protein TSUD_30360 [Trifolium subterraneum]|uniref:MULE transposase domain-containing protein n=1 Tax=Trifolium subterraneum TaxID=3900 RepID=A0A2Z6NVP0_TRISU|nr:hypothetical protein TSUD_30360 [Trifolium subterraneum]
MVVIRSQSSSNMDDSAQDLSDLSPVEDVISNDAPEVQREDEDTENSSIEGLGGCRFDNEKAMNSLEDITSGGFENVGFRRKDMYNKQDMLHLTSSTNAKAACEYLESMRVSDNTMFWRHKIDDDGRLTHLFWCDGAAQRDYSVFGDVVAIDATYKRNKYMCPLVIFSGVNNHNKTIVLCAAIVCDETERTYVWLLEQFFEAMGGKSQHQ